jgi:hypothetical protein
VAGCCAQEATPEEAKRQQLLRKAQVHQLEAQLLTLEAEALTLQMQKVAIQKQLDGMKAAVAADEKKPATADGKVKAAAGEGQIFSFTTGFTR